jgi:hypothetical protein
MSVSTLVTEADKIQADACIEFIRAHFEGKDPESLSDYCHNLMVAMKQDSINRRLAGITASAVPFFLREIGKMEEAKKAGQKPASEYLGMVGEKSTFRATLLNVFPHESDFGVSFITKMVTEKGEVLTWFASNDLEAKDEASARSEGLLCKGVAMQVTGTIKKHSEYNGTKQTTVTRCKVWSDAEVLADAEKAARKAAREAKKAAKVSKATTPA